MYLDTKEFPKRLQEAKEIIRARNINHGAEFRIEI